MTQFAASTCLTALLACSATAELKPSSEVTVILNFKGPHSAGTTREMQREAAFILKDAGVNLAWRPLAGASSETYSELVVLTFAGSCEFEPAPPLYDELGPYASTSVTDGQVLPFGEVDCARVVNSVRDAMRGEWFGWRDLLLGRALGRVVAHELVHMLTRSVQHGREGVTEASLSARQLISGSLRLEKDDVLRLRERPIVRWPSAMPDSAR
jgi:hypothetical protein